VDGKILASCEDVSRSSSVDNTVGAALLVGVHLSGCALNQIVADCLAKWCAKAARQELVFHPGGQVRAY
jgi:hypothetical protein